MEREQEDKAIAQNGGRGRSRENKRKEKWKRATHTAMNTDIECWKKKTCTHPLVTGTRIDVMARVIMRLRNIKGAPTEVHHG